MCQTISVMPEVTIGTLAAGKWAALGKALQGRGLFVRFLPTHSPHLNTAGVPWRKLNCEWLRPEDYGDADTSRLAVWTALGAVGQSLMIGLTPFKKILENGLT